MPQPLTGIAKTKPRTELPGERLNRKENEQLSRDYITARNRKLLLSIKQQEIEIAQERNLLVERRLVERQSMYLLVAMRRKLLNMSSYAHRFSGTEINTARAILREIGLSVLAEIQDLPNCVEENWLQKVEEKES